MRGRASPRGGARSGPPRKEGSTVPGALRGVRPHSSDPLGSRALRRASSGGVCGARAAISVSRGRVFDPLVRLRSFGPWHPVPGFGGSGGGRESSRRRLRLLSWGRRDARPGVLCCSGPEVSRGNASERQKVIGVAAFRFTGGCRIFEGRKTSRSAVRFVWPASWVDRERSGFGAGRGDPLGFGAGSSARRG